jgi:DNA polymerase elongation subunit (family B)
MKKQSWTFDIECYQNYFLALFRNTETGDICWWQIFNDAITTYNASAFNPNNLFISFNGNRYDLPMLTLAWKNPTPTNAQLKQLSDALIVKGIMPWQFEKQYDLNLLPWDHIDLIEVAPLKASLKIYGGRLGSKKLQDLPIPPGAVITEDQVPRLRRYCENDNVVTADLYNNLKPQLDLREKLSGEYQIDLRSKSDAQIAEAVIAHEYKRITQKPLLKPNLSKFIGKAFKYKPPKFIEFQTDLFNDLLVEICAADFLIKEDGGVQMPDCLKNRTIKYEGRTYKMGVGGIHSMDPPGEFRQTPTMNLIDIDVASYYPSIILNAGFYPSHIGPVFLDIYRSLVNRRIDAKHSSDEVTADSLKITINGTFGKLGSKWSKVYSPDLMFHVTVTGQLCLLMLIEKFGEYTISANTDGLTLHYPAVVDNFVMEDVAEWENHTGFAMERTDYLRLNRRDISNYLAVKHDGSLKGKGMFAKDNLAKNPVNQVCIDAVKAFIQKGISVEQTILSCSDIKRFITLRTVKGGAEKDGLKLGKSVRWYYSKFSFTPIYYSSNGNTVPRSEGAVPLMDFSDHMPTDLDYKWYIYEAENILDSIGA